MKSISGEGYSEKYSFSLPSFPRSRVGMHKEVKYALLRWSMGARKSRMMNVLSFPRLGFGRPCLQENRGARCALPKQASALQFITLQISEINAGYVRSGLNDHVWTMKEGATFPAMLQ